MKRGIFLIGILLVAVMVFGVSGQVENEDKLGYTCSVEPGYSRPSDTDPLTEFIYQAGGKWIEFWWNNAFYNKKETLLINILTGKTMKFSCEENECIYDTERPDGSRENDVGVCGGHCVLDKHCEYLKTNEKPNFYCEREPGDLSFPEKLWKCVEGVRSEIVRPENGGNDVESLFPGDSNEENNQPDFSPPISPSGPGKDILDDRGNVIELDDVEKVEYERLDNICKTGYEFTRNKNLDDSKNIGFNLVIRKSLIGDNFEGKIKLKNPIKNDEGKAIYALIANDGSCKSDTKEKLIKDGNEHEFKLSFKVSEKGGINTPKVVCARFEGNPEMKFYKNVKVNVEFMDGYDCSKCSEEKTENGLGYVLLTQTKMNGINNEVDDNEPVKFADVDRCNGEILNEVYCVNDRKRGIRQVECDSCETKRNVKIKELPDIDRINLKDIGYCADELGEVIDNAGLGEEETSDLDSSVVPSLEDLKKPEKPKNPFQQVGFEKPLESGVNSGECKVEWGVPVSHARRKKLIDSSGIKGVIDTIEGKFFIAERNKEELERVAKEGDLSSAFINFYPKVFDSEFKTEITLLTGGGGTAVEKAIAAKSNIVGTPTTSLITEFSNFLHDPEFFPKINLNTGEKLPEVFSTNEKIEIYKLLNEKLYEPQFGRVNAVFAFAIEGVLLNELNTAVSRDGLSMRGFNVPIIYPPKTTITIVTGPCESYIQINDKKKLIDEEDKALFKKFFYSNLWGFEYRNYPAGSINLDTGEALDGKQIETLRDRAIDKAFHYFRNLP